MEYHNDYMSRIYDVERLMEQFFSSIDIVKSDYFLLINNSERREMPANSIDQILSCPVALILLELYYQYNKRISMESGRPNLFALYHQISNPAYRIQHTEVGMGRRKKISLIFLIYFNKNKKNRNFNRGAQQLYSIIFLAFSINRLLSSIIDIK